VILLPITIGQITLDIAHDDIVIERMSVGDNIVWFPDIAHDDIVIERMSVGDNIVWFSGSRVNLPLYVNDHIWLYYHIATVYAYLLDTVLGYMCLCFA
jgi:hypothetical protein